MTSDIQIRKLKLLEVPELLNFRKFYDYKPQADQSRERESLTYTILKIIWHRDRMINLVALKEGKIVGYVSAIFGKHKHFKGNVYIVNASVNTHLRGEGIGTTLFSAIEVFARAKGTRRVELEVFGRNEGAIRLYKRLGYEIEGIKRHAVENGVEYDDLIFMAKLLN